MALGSGSVQSEGVRGRVLATDQHHNYDGDRHRKVLSVSESVTESVSESVSESRSESK